MLGKYCFSPKNVGQLCLHRLSKLFIMLCDYISVQSNRCLVHLLCISITPLIHLCNRPLFFKASKLEFSFIEPYTENLFLYVAQNTARSTQALSVLLYIVSSLITDLINTYILDTFVGNVHVLVLTDVFGDCACLYFM